MENEKNGRQALDLTALDLTELSKDSSFFTGSEGKSPKVLTVEDIRRLYHMPSSPTTSPKIFPAAEIQPKAPGSPRDEKQCQFPVEGIRKTPTRFQKRAQTAPLPPLEVVPEGKELSFSFPSSPHQHLGKGIQ